MALRQCVWERSPLSGALQGVLLVGLLPTATPPAGHRQDDLDNELLGPGLCKAGGSRGWVAAAGRGWACLQQPRQLSRKENSYGESKRVCVSPHTFPKLEEGASHVLTKSEGFPLTQVTRRPRGPATLT